MSGQNVEIASDFRKQGAVDWPTLALMLVCYGAWGLAITLLARISLPAAIVLTTLTVTLHSSLQHEVLHGHPFRFRLVNEALVFLPVGLIIPYGRFRDTHLAHHHDEILTDPYDDPESNFLDPVRWARLSAPARWVLQFNNTLLGRMLLGPGLGSVRFAWGDLQAIAAGDRAILRDWLLHLAGLCLILPLIAASAMPFWAYAIAAYMGLSILKIRTFLEHRANDLARGRTVIIEGGLILPFLFLNNNLHAVHHCRPAVAWYRLPALYRQGRDDYLKRNDGYLYRSYAQVFRQHLLRAKDPIPHPLWPAPKP